MEDLDSPHPVVAAVHRILAVGEGHRNLLLAAVVVHHKLRLLLAAAAAGRHTDSAVVDAD